MTENLTVRVGTLNDLDEMMDLAMMATEENSFAPPEPMKLLHEIYPALMQDHGIVGIVGELGGIIEGAVLLRVGQIWYSNTPILEEKAIFVHPDYRVAKHGRARGMIGHARKLMEFSKQTSDALGLTLTIGVMSSERTEAKVRAYRRVFGEPSGAYWLYGTKTGQSTDSH